MRYFTLLVVMTIASLRISAQEPTFQIKLEEEDLVDLTHWVDQDGFTLIDAFFDSHNHYFFLLNPEGEVISTYKNFFQNIFYKGFSSNNKELTMYFSRTPNGEVQFLDFFKTGDRPPLSTIWVNAPKSSPDLKFDIEGTMYHLSFDKKKSQLLIKESDGPATEFVSYSFPIEKEQAKVLLKDAYRGVGLDEVFIPHFGKGVVTKSDETLLLLTNQNDKWTRYWFDLKNSTLKINDHTLPDIRNVINYRTDAFISNGKIFFETTSPTKICLQITDFDLNMLMDKCYDESSGIDFKTSGLFSFGGKQIDEKWGEKDNYNSKILDRMSNEQNGYVSVFYHQEDDAYSLKLGGESPITSGAGAMIPNPAGGFSMTGGGGSPASSTTFNGNFSGELVAINRPNFFSQVLENTEMQFNLPYSGQGLLLLFLRNSILK